MRLGLRDEILGGVAAVTVTAMLALAWLILRGAEREILLEARRSARVEIAALARDLDVAAGAPDRVRALGGVAHRYAGGRRLLRVEIFDAVGAPLASASRGVPPAVDDALVGEALRDGEAVQEGGVGGWRAPEALVIAQRVGEGAGATVFAATVDLGETLARVERLRLISVAFTALALFIALFAGREFLRRRLLTPIERLGDATARVAAGDYALRVDTHRADEMGALERSFNRMAEALGAGRARTDAHIAELESLNARLRASQREVVQAEKLATVGQLAAGVAHEIGNPLGAIRGNAELLEAGDLSGDEARRVLANLNRATERIDRIVRALLDFARPAKASREWLSPGDVVARAVELVRFQRSHHDVRFEVAGRPGCPRIHTDPNLMEQILVNLLLNAAQALDAGGVVTIRAEAAPGATGEPALVHLTVTDTGPGVPEGLRETIFDPFFTTKGPGRGTGLGLAVSRRIARDLGGELALVPGRGPGATFRLTMPIEEPRP